MEIPIGMHVKISSTNFAYKQLQFLYSVGMTYVLMRTSIAREGGYDGA